MLQRITHISLAVLSLSLILYFGAPLFIPLSYGLLIAFILYPICHWLEQRRVPRLAATILSLLLISLLIASIVLLFFYQIKNFLSEWEHLKKEIDASLKMIKETIIQRWNIPAEVIDDTITQQLHKSAGRVIDGLGNSIIQLGTNLVMLFIIPVFSFLILMTRGKLLSSMELLFPKFGRSGMRSILQNVIKTYYKFIQGMLIVYLLVAILNSIGLWLIGIPHAVLFGCVASILTFIPYVGIMVGALLPITIAWITYSSIWYPLGVIAVFAVVQYLEANIIFPYAVGSRLNLNTLVTLMAIFIGGIIWGVSGMILFVPYLAIIKLLTDEQPELKAYSDLLSDKS